MIRRARRRRRRRRRTGSGNVMAGMRNQSVRKNSEKIGNKYSAVSRCRAPPEPPLPAIENWNIRFPSKQQENPRRKKYSWGGSRAVILCDLAGCLIFILQNKCFQQATEKRMCLGPPTPTALRYRGKSLGPSLEPPGDRYKTHVAASSRTKLSRTRTRAIRPSCPSSHTRGSLVDALRTLRWTTVDQTHTCDRIACFVKSSSSGNYTTSQQP